MEYCGLFPTFKACPFRECFPQTACHSYSLSFILKQSGERERYVQ